MSVNTEINNTYPRKEKYMSIENSEAEVYCRKKVIAMQMARVYLKHGDIESALNASSISGYYECLESQARGQLSPPPPLLPC